LMFFSRPCFGGLSNSYHPHPHSDHRLILILMEVFIF
jgi:hypothetical protein